MRSNAQRFAVSNLFLGNTTEMHSVYLVSGLPDLKVTNKPMKLICDRGQRRKEHLSKLEAAQREASSQQIDEVDRLRRENLALQHENETLKATYGSASKLAGAFNQSNRGPRLPSRSLPSLWTAPSVPASCSNNDTLIKHYNSWPTYGA